MITVICLLISKNGLLPSPSVIPNRWLTMSLQPNCVNVYGHFTTPHTFPLYLSHPSMMRWLSLDLKQMPITTLDDLYDYYDFSLNESRTTDSWTCLRSTLKPHYISKSNLNLNLVGALTDFWLIWSCFHASTVQNDSLLYLLGVSHNIAESVKPFWNMKQRQINAEKQPSLQTRIGEQNSEP